MGRHKKSIERPLMPDVKYNSKVITKFVSRMMLDGKKATCTKIVYREALAMRWIIDAARNRSGHGMADTLAAELLDAYNNTGSAYKKREDVHKMAEANKAFAHYRW